MCWSSTDSGENYTTCECPKECSADPEPWEFEYIDRDKNNVLDTAEIQDVFSDVLDFEPCLYGFLKSCDLNEKEGIDKREWDFCFPKTGTAFETRK
ncbi:hypothetical protein pdam_00008178 [Pocillopora damicornis]|uniref:SPARC/Testican calcium-binding domain-containing protein n=1 Tax=Pocillopora damicornis TaxID=46731 RepID=A0A3M6TC50_POCDA|nr:hypothetical protein pdam_00008178 [Pocillopora damicornis]